MMILFLLAATSSAAPIALFPNCSSDSPDECPSDLDDWELISWVPEESGGSIRAAEHDIGTGIALDEALQLEAGDWGVVIAVLDTGVRWTSREVSTTTWLNPGELPLPIGADGVARADPNDDGRLSIDDWHDDPRVSPSDGVDEADDRLDPSDLIAAFGDGVDDDGNGWVDDIAGWDFFEDDNDPFAVTGGANGDHGTGVMSSIAADGDDGGTLGVCPNCSVLPLRVGDSFITNGDRVGPAIRYATEMGARVVAMAIGGLSQPAHVEEAIRAADQAGVILVGAAGDENSWHRNRPAASDPVLFVHSIRSNNLLENSNSRSYLGIWNCNNWGPRLDLVAPAEACATGAVASTAGAAGLVLAAAERAGRQLSPAQVRGLLLSTATDVDVPPEEQAEAGIHPSHEGWDPFYGHGRLHAGRAVAAATAEPWPIAELHAPRWGAWVEGTVEVTGATNGPWTLTWGVGVDPAEWTELASGAGPVSGVLGTLDADEAPQQNIPEDLALLDSFVDRLDRAHEPLVTIRLEVEDDLGRTSTVRRGVWVHEDPDLLPGFPLTLPDSLEAAIVLADLDEDAVFEIVFADSGGTVHALGGDGTSLPGWPVQTQDLPLHERAPWRDGIELPREGVLAAPAVGDLDGDGSPEVVVATLEGGIYAWSTEGALLEGFPVRTVGRPPAERGPGDTWEDGVLAAPSLGDVDGDGDLEIVVGAMDRRLYVWDETGALHQGYPLDLCSACDGPGDRIVGGAALGDVDGDGDLDAVIGTGESPVTAGGWLFAVDLRTAEVWPGWPLERPGVTGLELLPLLGEGHPSSPALADLDGDGDLEIWSYAILGTAGPIHHDGSEYTELGFTASSYALGTNVSEAAFVTLATQPAIGDLDGDGFDDLVVGGSGLGWPLSLASAAPLDFQHTVGAWSGADGSMLQGWPRQIDDTAFLTAPALADVDGDGRAEVIASSGGHFVGAWDATGELASGWPKFTGGWSTAGATTGDIDGDGYRDIVIGTRAGQLFAWRTPAAASTTAPWPSPRHDSGNTGSRSTPLPAQPGPRTASRPAPEAAGGCCGGGRATLTPLLLLAPLLVRRRSGSGRP